jgi:hypothetical protein
MQSMVPRTTRSESNEQKKEKRAIPWPATHRNRIDAQTITSFVIAGVTMPTKDIISNLQSLIDSAKSVQTTRATWQNTVKTDIAEREKLKTFVSGLKQALLVAFAGSVDTLADFGLTGRKQRVVTPEEKTAAAAKAKATRAARHTVGKKQKSAIKGTVTTTAPSAPAAASAPTPAPVPSPAPAPAPVAAPTPVIASATTATPGTPHLS